MKDSQKELILKNFQTIPGIGKEISKDFWKLGLRSVADLKDKDPEGLYDELCNLHKRQVDRCVLYVFRCAVYFASTKKQDPEKLKWWNWKDK